MADNRSYVYRRLRRELGLTAAQAAGAVGGLGGESGRMLDPNAVNPSSGALGIGQWLGGRARGVRKGDLRSQTSHLISELKGPERAALSRLRSAHDIQSATRAWVEGFERPSAGEIRSSMPARLGYARDAFNTFGGSGGGSSSGSSGATSGRGRSSGTPSRTITETTPGVDNSAARRSLVLDFLGNKNSDVLDFAVQAKQLADIPGVTTTRQIPGASGSMADPSLGGGGGGGSDLAAVAAQRASTIDKQRLPYSWGGGHGGKTPIHDAVPLDCSGAVSKVLGINPRVSGEFGKWGRPGDGGGQGVTVYSNGHHVLMKINNHFFGTSATNPGGGAGWIPAGAISKEYLKGFTARHSNR